MTKSSTVASIWWNLPKTVLAVHRQRVEALGEREAAEDVDQAAGGRDRREAGGRSRSPSPTPTTTWVSDVEHQPGGVERDAAAGDGRHDREGQAQRRAPPWPASGRVRPENGGTTTSHATIRTEASRKATQRLARRRSGSSCARLSPAASGCRSKRSLGEVDQGVQHPVARDQQGDADADQLRARTRA